MISPSNSEQFGVSEGSILGSISFIVGSVTLLILLIGGFLYSKRMICLDNSSSTLDSIHENTFWAHNT